MSKAFKRSIKNVVSGYTSAQVKVRNGELIAPFNNPPIWPSAMSSAFHWHLRTNHRGDNITVSETNNGPATSNEPYGPSQGEMEDLVELTYEQ